MRSKGATIIELTVVLVVISVLCALTLPRAGGFIDRIEVRGAVTEIESLFSLARHVAIAHGAQSVLDIDTSTGCSRSGWAPSESSLARWVRHMG